MHRRMRRGIGEFRQLVRSVAGGVPEEVLYDGADNTNTDFASLAQSNYAIPSPQVVSSSPIDDFGEVFKAFNQFNTEGGAYATHANSFPVCPMIDLGIGKLINKYALAKAGDSNRPKDWVFQGSNTVGCAAGDEKNANGWTDLDTRTDSATSVVLFNDMNSNFLTFSCGVAYRFFRLYITETSGGIASYGVRLDEIKLVAQAI